MPYYLKILLLVITLAPLLGSVMAGLAGKGIGRRGAHWVTIFFVAIAFVCALIVAKWYIVDHTAAYQVTLYNWALSGKYQFNIGFLIDRLSAMMLVIVTFVSFMVHIYSMGYMADDPGYQRFFSYVSLFTFAMLCLVLANNFLLLYFGWEGVGLVSYLLIGFWFNKDTAVFGSLKAFLANRVGDAGFLLGIAVVLMYFGSVNYLAVFSQVNSVASQSIGFFPGMHWSPITLTCILLLIGAMGKSAQMPLHVWLPESMEGPTPISALIHAATMVTAGVYMITRMSPLFEHSTTALSVVLVIGASTCLFTGIIGFVQQDVKRVVAYSTLSQLGYMIAALGASAFAAGMFHLFMHACFKALLFLSAGSVIVAMHHDQDMRRMGGLWKYMPVTYICFLIGALSLSAVPPFSGFYSKDSIIAAVSASHIPGSGYATFCVTAGAFVTAFYIFRAFFLTFHGKEKMSEDVKRHLKESPWSMKLPMIALAIPSVIMGALLVKPILYSPNNPLLGAGVYVAPAHDVLARLLPSFHGAWMMFWHAFVTLPFWLAVLGIFTAWALCIKWPQFADMLKMRFEFIYNIMLRKYGFDDFNQIIFVRGAVSIARWCFNRGDKTFVDDVCVNGVGRLIQFYSSASRQLQTGYINHYAFAMMLGLIAFMVWFLLG